MNYTKNFLDGSYYNNPIFETEHFIVIPSIGSIVEGWLLILPKTHYLSFGEIGDFALYEELQELIEDVCDSARASYGDFVIFEHGPVNPESIVGCGVDYAHVHMVPVKLTIADVKSFSPELNLEWKPVNSIADTCKYSQQRLPYLFFSDYQTAYLTTNKDIPSQFFRKLIAQKVNLPNNWNWKEYPFYENIKKTISSLSKENTSIVT